MTSGPQNEGFAVTRANQWPPPIPRNTPDPEQKQKSWLRPFSVYLGLLYFTFTVFLVCLLVPSCRDVILAIERHHDLDPEPSYLQRYFYLSCLYYAPPFQFTAGCLAVASAVGLIVALWKFAVAVNGHGRFGRAAVCCFASALPGSLGCYLAYCEYGYLG
jgi:hypothetical protein